MSCFPNAVAWAAFPIKQTSVLVHFYPSCFWPTSGNLLHGAGAYTWISFHYHMGIHIARFWLFLGCKSLSWYKKSNKKNPPIISMCHIKEKWEAPRHCSISAKYSAVVLSPNYSTGSAVWVFSAELWREATGEICNVVMLWQYLCSCHIWLIS